MPRQALAQFKQLPREIGQQLFDGIRVRAVEQAIRNEGREGVAESARRAPEPKAARGHGLGLDNAIW
jgi:hypothetical protein